MSHPDLDDTSRESSASSGDQHDSDMPSLAFGGGVSPGPASPPPHQREHPFSYPRRPKKFTRKDTLLRHLNHSCRVHSTHKLDQTGLSGESPNSRVRPRRSGRGAQSASQQTSGRLPRAEASPPTPKHQACAVQRNEPGYEQWRPDFRLDTVTSPPRTLEPQPPVYLQQGTWMTMPAHSGIITTGASSVPNPSYTILPDVREMVIKEQAPPFQPFRLRQTHPVLNHRHALLRRIVISTSVSGNRATC